MTNRIASFVVTACGLFTCAVALVGSATPAAAADPMRISGRDWLACFTKEDYQELVHVALQEDEQAFQDMVSSDRCFPLRNGVAVRVEETSPDGLIAIRAEGTSTRVWTTGEAVQPLQE